MDAESRTEQYSGAVPFRQWAQAGAGWLLTATMLIGLYAWWMRPDLRLWEGIVTHGDPVVRSAALTFDDGPHPLWAPLLADTLEQHGAKGTFFVVGLEAEVYPEITARLARGGHQVAMHSMTHPYPNLSVFPEQRVKHEIDDCATVLKQLTGKQQLDFRPPGGGISDTLLELLRQRGMTVAWWSANAGDWISPSPQVIEWRLRAAMRPGAVMLLHERAQTIAALERYFAKGTPNLAYDTFSDVTRH